MSTDLPLIDNLTVYEGDDYVLSFASRLPDISGYAVKLQVRMHSDSRYVVLESVGTVTSPTTYDVSIPKNYTLGKARDAAYVYGIKLTDPTGFVTTDRQGKFLILERTTADGSVYPEEYGMSLDDVIDTQGLTGDEVLKWDSSKRKLVASGVMSEDTGDLTTATNSVNIGVHDIGSAGRNIAVTNRADGRTFNPIFQEVGVNDANTTKAFQREHGAMEDLLAEADDSTVLTNPMWTVTPTDFETTFAIQLKAVSQMEDVLYTIYENGEPIYKANLGTVVPPVSGVPPVIYLDTPYSLFENKLYSIDLTCKSGAPCQVLGNPSGKPWYNLKIRKFQFKELATQEYVDNHGTLPSGIALEVLENGTQAVADTRRIDFGSDFTVTTDPFDDKKAEIGITFPTPPTVLENFTELLDTPADYTGAATYLVSVKATEDGLEFVPKNAGGVESLGDLTDVLITSPEEGHTLVFTGSVFENDYPLPDVNVVSYTPTGIVGALVDYTSNIIYMDNQQDNVEVALPQGRAGSFLLAINKNRVFPQFMNLVPDINTTIGGSTTEYTIQLNQQVMFKYNDITADWEVLWTTPVNEGIHLYKDADSTLPDFTDSNIVFPTATITQDTLGNPVVDTSISVQDDTTGSVTSVNEVKFNNATVTEEAIPNSNAKRAVVDVNTGLQMGNDGLSFTEVEKLTVESPRFYLEEESLQDKEYYLHMNTPDLYLRPVNAMYSLVNNVTVQPNPNYVNTLMYMDGAEVHDEQIQTDPINKFYTVTPVGVAPLTYYYIRLELHSDDLSLNPLDGYSDVVELSIIDHSTYSVSTTGSPLVDINGDYLSETFRIYEGQSFGTRVIEGVIEVSNPLDIAVQLRHRFQDSFQFLRGINNRLTIYQVDSLTNRAGLSGIYETALGTSIPAQESFLIGGNFLSQSFDLGATESPQTLTEGQQIKVANGWWLDAVGDGCVFQKTDEGLQLSGAGTQAPFMPELHHAVSNKLTKALAYHEEEVTFTVKAEFDEPVFMYVLGWNGTEDSVYNRILDGYLNNIHDYDSMLKVLGSVKLNKDGVGRTLATESVTVKVPKGIKNLVVSLTTEEVSPNTVIVKNVKAEVGKSFTGFTFIENDNEPFMFGVGQVDVADTSYELTASNVSETLPLNTVASTKPNEPYVSINTTHNAIKLTQLGQYNFDYLVSVIRSNTTGGDVQWGSWLEYSVDNGASWTYVTGSSTRMIVTANDTDGVLNSTCAVPFVVEQTNTLVRGRHACTNAASGIAVLSFGATPPFPVCPAWRLTGTKF